jgi:hypothetical protein
MQDLQTGRPVKLSDFIAPGTKVRYAGRFFIDRYADLVNLSATPVLWQLPNHTWDNNDNTHVGGTGTGDGGTDGNASRWRSCIWSNHFLYTNMFEAGRTGSNVIEVAKLTYNYKQKHYSDTVANKHTEAEIYCMKNTSDGVRRAAWRIRSSISPGYGTNIKDMVYEVRNNNAFVPWGYNNRWYGGQVLAGYPGDATCLAEIKDHIALGMLGGFVPTLSHVNGRNPYISAMSVDLDFTILY